MVQRKCAAAILVASFAAACSGGGPEPTSGTTGVLPWAMSTPAAPSTTAGPAVTLSSAIEKSVASETTFPLIVAGEDGLFEVHILGGKRRLTSVEVEFAIDDAQGGLLFQVHRGRPKVVDDAEHDSTIWWLPAGESTARMLLLSTVEAGGELSLQDAYVSGGLHVIYSRHEASVPSADGVVSHIDRLRSLDVEKHKSIDLVTEERSAVRLDNVSCDQGVIAFTRQAAAVSECRFLDFAGVEVTVPAAPGPPCRGDCRRICLLRWGGSLLMLLQDRHESSDVEAKHLEQLDFVDTATAQVLDSLVLPVAADRVAAVDLLGPWLVVSPGRNARALVFDLRVIWAGAFELPVSGVARFTRAPLDVGNSIEF
jgi:hypothetical protein